MSSSCAQARQAGRRQGAAAGDGKGARDGGPSAATAAPAPAVPASATPAASQCALVLTLGDRRLELRLSVEGNALHTHGIEQYPDASAAEAAFAQVRAALEAEGYRPQ